MDFFKTILTKYRLPEEVNFYAGQVEIGLTEEEKKMLFNFLTSPARILDVGCGAGREAFPLARLGYEVTAVDICPELIKEGKRWAHKFRLPVDFRLLGPGQELSFPEGMFSAALLLSQFLGHIQGRENRVAYLQRIRHFLAPGGFLFLTVHDRSAAEREEWEELKVAPGQGGEEGDIWIDQISDHPTQGQMYFHLYHRDEIIRDVQEAGFKIQSWWSVIDPLEDEEITVWDRFIYLVGMK